jgi:hypothetical protein
VDWAIEARLELSNSMAFLDDLALEAVDASLVTM